MMDKWRNLYLREIMYRYGSYENYLAQKFILQKPFLDMIEQSIISDKPLIECGAGTAKRSAFFAALGHNAFAVDLDDGMLEMAKRTSIVISPNNPVTIVKNDILNLPYENKSFSVSHSGGVLEHYQDDEIVAMLKEQMRVSDKVCFSVPSTYYGEEKMYGDERRLTERQWNNLIYESGAKITSTVQYHGRPLKHRIIDIAKDPRRLFRPKANIAFALEPWD